MNTGIDPEVLAPSRFRSGRSSSPLPVVTEAFAHVYELIGRGGYDVVHNHAFDVPAVSLSSALRCPIVHTLHLPPDDLVGKALIRAASTGSRMVIATVSRSLAASWAPTCTVNAVLRNGVPVGRIPWSESGGDSALFAARLSPEKGALEALEIAERAGLALTLIGNPYDAHYARQVENRCRSVKGARLEPPVPRLALWERMCRSSLVLCTSRWDEPFGMVAAESLACGTPVLGFARGGLPEILEGGSAGTLVPDGDVVAAAAAARHASAIDRGSCRRHAQLLLDLERTLDAHEALYSRLLTQC